MAIFQMLCLWKVVCASEELNHPFFNACSMILSSLQEIAWQSIGYRASETYVTCY